MRQFGYSIIHLIELIRFFGLADGAKIFFKIITKAKGGIVEFNCKKFPNAVQIRKTASDLPIFYQVFAELQYDINFFLPFKPLSIIDCGANVGYSALYFASNFPEATIVAVEPEANNFKQLQRNTANYKKMILLHAAIWHKQSNLEIIDESEWSASFEVQESLKSKSILKGITINEIASNHNFEQIDILKIDIEGAEYNLFANDPHTWLRMTRCLIIELHDVLRVGTSQIFFKEMANYNWRTFIKGENIVCFKD